MKTRSTSKRYSFPAMPPETDELPEKLRRVSARPKGKVQKIHSMKNGRSFLSALSLKTYESPKKQRGVSPTEKCNGEKTIVMENDRSSLCAVSLKSDESPGKRRRVSPRQKCNGGKTNSMQNESILLRAVSPVSDESSEKLRRVSPRQKSKEHNTNAVKTDIALLRVVCTRIDESLEKLRRVSPSQKCTGENSMKNERNLLRAISPGSDESPEKKRRVPPTQVGKEQKTNAMKNDIALMPAVSPVSDESPEKLRRVSPRQKSKEQNRNAAKTDLALLRVVCTRIDESVENLRRVSPRQKCNNENTNSMKNERNLLRAISPESDESPEKIRRVSSRQTSKELNTNAVKTDIALLRVVCPRIDESLEKLRRVSSRRKGNEENANSVENGRSSLYAVSLESDESLMKVKGEPPKQKGRREMSKSNDKSLLRAVSPESDELPEKVRRMSLRHKRAGQKTKSVKNDRSLLRAVSPETDESPEKSISVSVRQRGCGRKTEKIMNDSTSSSDKGYGGSSCEDDTDWQQSEGTTAAGSGVTLAKKRKSGDAPDESSDSSSDEFLVPTQSLDLNSDFFKAEKKELSTDFLAVKNSIFPCTSSLSESDDSDDLENFKPIERKVVTSQPGLKNGNWTVKNEYNSAESGSRQEVVNNVKPLPVRRGKKTLNAKQQKFADKDSREEKTQQDKLEVKSGHVEAEMDNRVQRAKSQVIGRKQLHKATVETSTLDVSKLDVSQLLALGEGLHPKDELKSSGNTRRNNFPKKDVDSEEEEISDWEEVGTSTFEGQQIEHSIPKEGIAVTVQVPNMHERKKKKKGFDVAAYIKRRMNRVRRDIQVLMHKAHLLCWIAHGNYVNNILNSEILMGLSLSLIPSKLWYPDKHVDLAYLQKIIQWFSKAVEVQENADDEEQLLVSLQTQFQNQAAKSKKYMVLMFVCVLRSLGINTRLVISLQPLPLKPPLSEISFVTSKNTSTSKGKKVKQEKQRKTHRGGNNDSPNRPTSDDVIWKKQGFVNKEEVVSCIGEATPQKVEQAGKSDQQESNKHLTVARKNIMPDSASDSGHSLRARKFVRKYIDDCTTDSDEEVVHKEQESVEDRRTVNRTPTTSKKKISVDAKNANAKDTKGSKVRNTSAIAHSSGSDCPTDIKILKNGKGKSDRRVLSSDSETEEAPVTYTKNKKKDRCDVWSEVFLESEKKWICVDVYHRQIQCVREISSRASQPVHYVLAWQHDGTIRDVTRRYCPKWHNVTRKLRVDEEWWRESLKPFTGQRTALDDQEDEDLYRQLQDRPIPTTLAEYKNHPLYALKRDLLKFQAIYPPDAPTLGFVRGHPVYARECVYTLQSRDRWLREAKVVRLGETPYKIVKARPKWDRMSGKVIKDIPLEIFGPWQVDDYVPPTAVDGKVPRCAYGNVELFKPSMLPGGTIHMQIPGLNRIARKLQIDCAPAIIGFGYTNGLWGPIYDGFVVCEEYKYVLAEAWQAEEEDADRCYEEKRLKRIYGNWKRLIKGLFIRERLKARYNFGPVKETTKAKTKKANTFLEPKRIKTVDSDDFD